MLIKVSELKPDMEINLQVSLYDTKPYSADEVTLRLRNKRGEDVFLVEYVKRLDEEIEVITKEKKNEEHTAAKPV